MLVVPHLATPAAPSHHLRMVLVDRRPLFLAALAELIRVTSPGASLELTTDSERALQLARSSPVDLLFCEVRAVPISGPDIAARVTGSGLATRVVLIGDQDDQHLLISSLACGAMGFFTKDAAPEEFMAGAQAVLAGHLVLARELLPLTLRRISGKDRGDWSGQLARLSDAERSILLMIGQAQSTRAIAAVRGVSEKTVRNHLASIYRKLAVRNRSEAIVWSARAGLTRAADGA
ncbi:MAG TPA: response regulator transcription factor [Candidatus Dormibacteraeota bacterium]